MPTPVEQFLAARPFYDRANVEEIAARCAELAVPFCSECADWHTDAEDHSASIGPDGAWS